MRYIAGVVVVMLLVAVTAPVVLAQQGPGGGPGPMMQGGQGKQGTPETFAERKVRIQKLLEERKTRLAEEKACVDKATNDDELMKCRPQRPQHEGGGMQHRGPMGGPGPQPPMGGPGGM